MSIELNKLAAEFNRYFTSSNGVDVPERVSVSRDEWRQLYAALHAYSKATQPAEMTDAEIDALCLSLTGFMTRRERDRAVARVILTLRPAAQTEQQPVASAPVADERVAKLDAECNSLAHQLNASNERNGMLRAALSDCSAELFAQCGDQSRAMSYVNAARAALAQNAPMAATTEPVAKAWADGYRQGIEDERISEANIGIAGFGAKVNPNRENPYANSHPAPGVLEAVAGELDPLRAYEFGQLITKYSESFNGQKWDGVYDSVDRKNLAVALDHLTEAGAMLMNISERLLRTNPAPAASVTDEQIREVFLANGFTIKEGHNDLKPYVYAAARAILALRHVQVPMTRDEAIAAIMSANISSSTTFWSFFEAGIRAAEAHHGITAQAKKEGV